MLASKYYISISEKEALEFYKEKYASDCPFKYFTSDKKIWWAVINGDNLPYTLCNDCYFNNRFGDSDVSIKLQLKPIFTYNLSCNCDGRTFDESFPLNLGDGWKLAVYATSPKLKLLKMGNIDINNNVQIATAYIDLKESEYEIWLGHSLLESIENITCELNINKNLIKPFLHNVPGTNFIAISLISINNKNFINYKKLHFDEKNNTVNVKLFTSNNNYQTKNTKELLVEFELVIKYVENYDNIPICVTGYDNNFNNKLIII